MVEVIEDRQMKIKLNLSLAQIKIVMTHPPGVLISLSSDQIEMLQGAAAIGVVVNNEELEEVDEP